MKPKKEPIDFENIGKQYGKPDIERLGIFVEAPYLNGKKYVSPFEKPRQVKGKNMLSEGRKTKCGTQHGYFEPEFKRLFEGEPWKKRSEKKSFRKVQVPFMPTGPAKWIATPGDYHGCFSGNIEAFSNVRRPVPKYKSPAANFMTNPVKKGGYGYADVCLSKYPQHLPDPYQLKQPTKQVRKNAAPPMITSHYPQPYFDTNPYVDPSGKIGPTYIRPKDKRIPIKGTFMPTGPAKWQAGCHAGCFSPFPEWIAGKPKKPVRRGRKDTHFYPQSMALKTMNDRSILKAYTDFRINHKNVNTYEPNYTKYLLD